MLKYVKKKDDTMKYRIEKRYPYSDTHCSGHEETYEAFVENIYFEPALTLRKK